MPVVSLLSLQGLSAARRDSTRSPRRLASGERVRQLSITVSGKPYSWVDDFVPSRRRTVVYSWVEHVIGPRFPNTDVPVPAEETPCAKEPDIWFPTGNTMAAKKDQSLAKRTCSGCWMRPECRDYGLAHPELEGVWGGLSQVERVRLTPRRRRGKMAP